jgi:HD-like signal output (HDOD) protein/CheY-like chemotaxis protein
MRALDLFEQAMAGGQGFDLVMLDIGLPDLTGEQVLKQLRRIEGFSPHRAAVVMVTAYSDPANVITCLNSGCDAYIAKPFNAEIINQKLLSLGIDRGGGAGCDPLVDGSQAKPDAIYQEICLTMRSGKFKLPALSQIGVQFCKLVDVNADVRQMAGFLKQDKDLAERLIRVANSDLYRGFGVVETIEQAIGRLGLTQTEQMVMALANRRLFQADQRKYRESLQHLWRHSLASAYAAETLTRSLERDLSVDPFCAGLFHDIGAVALLHIIAQMETHGRYGETIDNNVLCETIADHHALFGAKLLERWHFDTEYISITRHHNSLNTYEFPSDELLVVHFANLIAKSIGFTVDGHPVDMDLLDTRSAGALTLDAIQIETLKRKVAKRMKQSTGLLI